MLGKKGCRLGSLVGILLLLTTGYPYCTKADTEACFETDTNEESYETQKHYGIANVETILFIREGPGEEYPAVGVMEPDALCTVEETKGGWAKVTSGNIRGYAAEAYLFTGALAAEMVKNIGSENFPLADVYEEETVEAAGAKVATGAEVVDYALQFLGNPYVWGGTSLTEGADCSGFVQSVYSHFGIALPRVAEEQSKVGTKVDLGQLRPGDLVFYYDGEVIYHVVIYMGEGQVVHASSPKTGIKVSDLYYEQAFTAIRLV